MRLAWQIEKLTPKGLRPFARNIFRSVRKLFYGGDKVHCPICNGNFKGFAPAGSFETRYKEQCPGCGTRKRHRLLWLFLTRISQVNRDKGTEF